MEAVHPAQRLREAPASGPGMFAAAALGLVLLGFAISVDFPKAAHGFQSDEATYYSLAHSLARDLDFAFERRDLVRVWEEFPGPEGIFLKRGTTVSIGFSSRFPYLRRVKTADPIRDRLYYGKAYIYPLAAAPFVRLLGTNGFLVLHALLMTLNFLAAYVFLVARGSRAWAAVAYGLAFFVSSVVPVYFVSLTPELFNLSVVLYALFLWSYKEVAPAAGAGGWSRFLRSPASDVVAAALVATATFSKPLHAVLIVPLLASAALGRDWRHLRRVGLTFGAIAAALFTLNAAITGEFNYQGGYRKTFYSQTGFPLANERETFDSAGLSTATERVPIDILVNRDSLHVARLNLLYFVFGRYSGLVPYFFPGVLSIILFLSARGRRRWQWIVLATATTAVLVFILYMPFTYSGGGGSLGNRYYIGFYPMLLLLTPPLRGFGAALAAYAVGGLFTAKLVMNPFYSAFHPGEHAKAGPLRALPIELTMVNDLPVAANPDRSRRPLAGSPPLIAYFPDDNAYNPEGDAFWVKGKSTTEVILRAPTRQDPDGTPVPLELRRLTFEIRNNPLRNHVTVHTGRHQAAFELAGNEENAITLEVARGVPYRPNIYPTNYIYLVSISTSSGFVPFLQSTGSSDSRFLGAMVRIVPTYETAATGRR